LPQFLHWLKLGILIYPFTAAGQTWRPEQISSSRCIV
jgi:hypothetical protein